MTARVSTLRAAGLVALVAVSVGCARGCASPRPPIHPNPNMDYQEKYEAQEESAFFYDGATMRVPVEGTVARDRLISLDGRLTVAEDPHRGDAAYQTGRDANGEFLTASAIEASEALLARGAERYDIYCAPCHDAKGNGQGVLTKRAGVPVPSFHEPRLVDMAPGEIFDTITNGKGLMPAYRYPVPVADRWAIIAHVRDLQQTREGSP